MVATASRGLRTSTRDFDVAGVNDALASIGGELDDFLRRVDVDAGTAVVREFTCEARYAHQLWELDVPLGPAGRIDGAAGVQSLQDGFDAVHRAVFAVDDPGEEVEAITWRGDVRVLRPKPALPSRAHPDATSRRGPASRTAWFGREPHVTPVHAAADLAVGDVVKGPAIIEEPTTTIVVIPGAAALVRPAHYLVEVGA